MSISLGVRCLNMTCKIPQILSINIAGRRKKEFSELSQYMVVREYVPNRKSL